MAGLNKGSPVFCRHCIGVNTPALQAGHAGSNPAARSTVAVTVHHDIKLVSMVHMWSAVRIANGQPIKGMGKQVLHLKVSENLGISREWC